MHALSRCPAFSSRSPASKCFWDVAMSGGGSDLAAGSASAGATASAAGTAFGCTCGLGFEPHAAAVRRIPAAATGSQARVVILGAPARTFGQNARAILHAPDTPLRSLPIRAAFTRPLWSRFGELGRLSRLLPARRQGDSRFCLTIGRAADRSCWSANTERRIHGLSRRYHRSGARHDRYGGVGTLSMLGLKAYHC